MSLKNGKIDQYLVEGCMRCSLGGTPQCKVHKWEKELIKLRSILLECGLTEELKWSQPCYTFQGKNILILSAFKEYCALNFFKGSLIKDKSKLLTKAGENSQAARQMRFTSISYINKIESEIKAYLYEAIEIEKLGLKVETKKNPEPIPEELKVKFIEMPYFKKAFETLTLGRQRGYIIHFSQPKQSKTRTSRIEKYIPKILDGKGFYD